MIPRYENDSTARVFSDNGKIRRWLLVEKAVAIAQARAELIPPMAELVITATIDALLKDPKDMAVFVRQVGEREAEVRHDVAAFVDVLEARVTRTNTGGLGKWVHFGLTSSDVVDTGTSIALQQIGSFVRAKVASLDAALIVLGRRQGAVMAHTHGQPAATVSMAGIVESWRFGIREAERPLRNISLPGKSTGPIGMGVALNLEAMLGLPGLKAKAGATQVVPRWYYRDWAVAMSNMAQAIEKIGMDVRTMSTRGQVREGFADGQKGSSSMPVKRNPIQSERLHGIGVLSRAYAAAMTESAVLWDQRDISHSIVDRVALPDLSHLVLFALDSAKQVVTDLEVSNERQYVDSAAELNRLIRRDDITSRDEAYRRIQEARRGL